MVGGMFWMSGGSEGSPKPRGDMDVNGKGGSGGRVSGMLPWGNDVV